MRPQAILMKKGYWGRYWASYFAAFNATLECSGIPGIPTGAAKWKTQLPVFKMDQNIVNAFIGNCKTSGEKSARVVTWWSSNLQKLIMETRKLFLNPKTTKDWDEYTKTHTKYSKD